MKSVNWWEGPGVPDWTISHMPILSMRKLENSG